MIKICKEIINSFGSLSRRQLRWGAGLFTGVLLLALLYLFWPVSAQDKRRAAVLLESTSCYRAVCGEDTLFFASVDTIQGLASLSFNEEDCQRKDYEVGYFTSSRGRIVTHENAFLPAHDEVFFHREGKGLLEQTEAHLEALKQVLDVQIKEMEYYVRTHMHDDDGFEEMKSLLGDSKSRKVWLNRLSGAVHRMLARGDVRWSSEQHIRAYYVPDQERRVYACDPVSYSSGKAVTQLVERGLPLHGKSIANLFFSLSELVSASDSLQLDSAALHDALRHVGILQGKDFTYVGEIRAGSPYGYGKCSYADGTVSRGSWQNGLLNGEAEYQDTTGVLYSGVWAYGHLSGGTAVYPNGNRYVGSFLDDTVFDGGGELYGADGAFYLGSWADGERHGFGMSVTVDGNVQCGSWKEDEFEGERLLYTADRVYGIDIARYQHLNRRRRPCNISWKYLRITSLGKRSEKRISGTVSYPISFIYMKATEGQTITNKYFKDDYVQAKRLGIPVGSYHFFSSVPAENQLEWFFKNNRYEKGDLPPVLDLEPTDAYIKSRWGSDEKMFEQALKWLKGVEAKYGVKPLLYVNQGFIKKHLSKASEEMQNYDLWVARYGEFKPYSHMIYWQLSPDGKVSGIQNDVDINVFNGSKERFEEYVNAF